MGVPLELFAPLAGSYVLLKLYEDFFLEGVLMLPMYGNILVKILPIITLLIYAMDTEAVTEAFQMSVSMALVFSIGGDVMLELKHFKFHFMFGLVSFLIGHIWYIVAFKGKVKISALSLIGTAIVIGAIAYLGATFGAAAPPELSIPVQVYCAVIGCMAVTAILFSGDVPYRGFAIAGARGLRMCLLMEHVSLTSLERHATVFLTLRNWFRSPSPMLRLFVDGASVA